MQAWARRYALHATVGLALVLVGLAGAVAAAPPQPPIPPPPPPAVYKYASRTELRLGDAAQFLVTVINSTGVITDPVVWHNVRVTDAISPALRVDGAMVIPDDGEHEVAVVDHTVIATAPAMLPDEWLVVAIDCTLVDAGQPGPSIVNVARMDYEDEQGVPGEPFFSQPVAITVLPGGRIYLPVVMQGYPPPLPAPMLSTISNPDGDGTYIVSWSTVPGATTYALQEATEASFAGGTVVYEGSNASYGVDGRGPTRYVYRVKASDSLNESLWSNVEPVEVVWEKEPNDTAAQANGRIASGLTYYGVFPGEADVNDWFYFDLAVPFPLVELWLTNIPAERDYDLYLYDADGNLVATSDNYGNAPEQIQVPGLPTGRYYVRVYNYSQTGNGQPYHLAAMYR